MPHRLLVGTFHPCGTVTQCTGRDTYDWKKSLIWPRGIATSSASVSSTLPAVKPYQSAASPLHKIPDISKHDPAGSGADSSCIPALGAAKLRRARSSDIDVSALLLRLPPVENAQNGKGQQLNRLASSAGLKELSEAIPPPPPTLGDPAPGPARPTGSSLRPAPAPAAALVRPRPQPAPVPGRHHQHKVCANAEAAAAREPEPPRSIDSGGRMKRRSSLARQAAHGSSSNLKKKEDHATELNNNSKKAARIAVRVSMSMTRADSRSHAMAMDDVVLLMVPRDALGSRVIALALAAREFDWEDDHHVANGPENPDHFDLLRLRPATTYTAAGLGSQQDRFQIGAGVEKTKPIGDAGTLYFVLCRSRE